MRKHIVPDFSSPAAPSEKAADRSPASGSVDDLQIVTKAMLSRIPEAVTETSMHVAQSERNLAKSHKSLGDLSNDQSQTEEVLARSKERLWRLAKRARAGGYLAQAKRLERTVMRVG